jgi:lysophospholipase L1-like esterase
LKGFRSSLAADQRKVVICLGDSLTRGNVGFDYVDGLARRLEPTGYTVMNAGVNGELAWNLLQRVGDVISAEPAWVILWVGTNDARACENERLAARYVRRMKLSQVPDEGFFRKNYVLLLDRLQEIPSVRVALLTLPPLGERGGAGIDSYRENFSRFIEQQATERGLTCIPMGRLFKERLLADPSEKAPVYKASSSSRLLLRGVLYHYLLGWSWDRVASSNRMRLLTDMIHLNKHAGEMVIDEVEGLIRSDSEARTLTAR